MTLFFKSLLRGLILAAIVFVVLYAYHELSGHDEPLGRTIQLAAFVWLIGTATAYRTGKGLDPYPPWAMIGIGVIGLGFYTFWVLSPVGPRSTGELAAIALLAAVPAALLVYGIRRLRRKPEVLP